MDPSKSVTDLINEWPTRAAFAEAVGATAVSVHKWARFGRIPSGWQQAVVQAAEEAGISYVTPEWMLKVHAAEQPGKAVPDVPSRDVA